MPAERRVPFASKLSFGMGQIAEGVKNTGFGLFVLFYYNQVLGLEGSLCGLALGIALIFDAVTDPLAGSISDNWRSRWGRRHPFMVASALPLGLAFWALFSPPAGLGTAGLFAWLAATAVLTRAAMTLYHVPHMALGAEMTADFEERTSLVAYRMAFAYVGMGLAGGLGLGVFFADANGGRLNGAAYTPFALCMSALMVATVWISAFGTWREIPHLPPAQRSEGTRVLGRLLAETRGAFRNASFRWLFAGVLVIYVMVGIETALTLYVYEFFWELSGREILIQYAVYPIGLVTGAFVTRAFHRRFDKRPALMLGTGGWAVCQVTPVALRLVGWFPENGEPDLLPTLVGFRIVQGFLVQQALVSFGSMMADVTDEHELATGRRQEGVFFGAVAFSGKAATGVGSLLAGVSLDLIAWPTAAAVIPADAVFRLGVVYGPATATFAALSVWCYAHYGLTRARHQEIAAALRGET